MKRAIVVLIVLTSSALFAQVHGVPASVTSFSSFNNRTAFAPGVPASVTSLGPFGWTGPGCVGFPGCQFPVFGSNFRSQVPFAHFGGHHRHRVRFGSGGYVYVPYGYPVPVPVDEYGDQPVDEAADVSAEAADRRPISPADTRYGQHYLDSRDRQSAPVAQAEEQDPQPAPSDQNATPVNDEVIPVVIVFKDGHQQEIGNYAIVGDTLYEFGGNLSHKIKLADLDLKATVQKNEDRGVEFALPASYKPKA